MKILHVITSLRTGGAEKLMVDLLPRLRGFGHEVDLCVFDGIRTTFYHELENEGIRIIPLRKRRSVYDLRNIFALIKLMKSYDIIHSHNTACQLFVAIARVFCPNVFIITTEHNTSNRRRGKWYLKPGDLWMYNQYKNIICISDQARTNLEKYIGKSEKIVTFYNGIDLSKFQQVSNKEKKTEGKNIITMVAAFRAQKDHKTLIKAFDLLPDNYILQLVGDGELKEEMIDYIKQFASANRIFFLGNRNDIPEILVNSDIVVLSSHYEGLSLSSIEGMACGRPFIASDVEGLHEIVSGAGILFPHQDAEALACKIHNCCTDKEYASSIGKACLVRAQKYDIRKMSEQYSKLYCTLKKD